MALEQMAAKGASKLGRKASTMASSYNAAKSRMKSNFAAVGFGPTRQSNYNAGVDAAQYRAPDPNKWQTNWLAKMRE